MKAAVGLVLIVAVLASSAQADTSRRLLGSFNPLQSLLNKTDIKTIGKSDASRKPYNPYLISRLSQIHVS